MKKKISHLCVCNALLLQWKNQTDLVYYCYLIDFVTATILLQLFLSCHATSFYVAGYIWFFLSLLYSQLKLSLFGKKIKREIVNGVEKITDWSRLLEQNKDCCKINIFSKNIKKKNKKSSRNAWQNHIFFLINGTCLWYLIFLTVYLSLKRLLDICGELKIMKFNIQGNKMHEICRL